MPQRLPNSWRFLRALAIPQVVSKVVAIEATGEKTAVHPPMEGRQTVETHVLHDGEVARGM
jgi:hypothetical protein